MPKITKLVLCAVVGFLGSLTAHAPASAAVITFDDVTVPGTFLPAAAITSNGFTFTHAPAGNIAVIKDTATVCAGGCVDNGSQYLAVLNGAAPFKVVMSQGSGNPFTLVSFELATAFRFDPGAGKTVDVTGTLAGGGTVTQSVTYDRDPENFQTVLALSTFHDLTSVEFSSNDFAPAFDNFVTTVPEPATITIIGMGVAGTGWLRRRRKPH